MLYGGDLRVALRLAKRLDVSAGVGVMGEHEAVVADGLPGAGHLTDDLRYTTYAGLYVSLAKHLHFTEVVLFQDSGTDSSDVRLYSYSGLFGQVNAWLEVGAILSVSFDSQPPPGVKTTDSALRTFVSIDI